MKTTYTVGILAVILFLQPVICPAPAFMKLGDIKGEAIDEAHFEWSVAHSVAFDVDRSGGTNADATFGDVVCVKEIDKSTPKLMEACALGTAFPEATFDLTRTREDGAQEPYLRYKLKDVLVTSYSFHGTSDSDPPPTEEISLNYEEIKFSYRAIRKSYLRYDENGNLVETVSVGLPARLGATPPPPDASASVDSENILMEQHIDAARIDETQVETATD